MSFPDVADIRPTPDRVRETLFNWLQFDIAGRRCIEVFAGSGILSFEALSRGASFVTLIDRNPAVCRGLRHNLEVLGVSASRFEIIEGDGVDWLAGSSDRWDIAFLDPPFDGDALSRAIEILPDRLEEDGLVYTESRDILTGDSLGNTFGIHRQKRAGQVNFALLRKLKQGTSEQ